MLQLTPQSTIFVAAKHVDFRKGIDGLAAFCRQKLEQDPLSGAIFLFYNRKHSAIKILTYDGQGSWLCMKRLSKGKFHAKPKEQKNSTLQQICHRTLLILINNGNPITANISKNWRKIKQ